MCISNETINAIESSLIQLQPLTTNPVPMLKNSFPQVSFLHMSAADIDEAPFRATSHYNLHLLDGREHCVQLTHDLHAATAIVIAQK